MNSRMLVGEAISQHFREQVSTGGNCWLSVSPAAAGSKMCSFRARASYFQHRVQGLERLGHADSELKMQSPNMTRLKVDNLNVAGYVQ